MMPPQYMASWRPPQDYNSFIENQIQVPSSFPPSSIPRLTARVQNCDRRLGTLGAVGNSGLAARQELQRLTAACRVFRQQINEACPSISQVPSLSILPLLPSPSRAWVQEICRYDMAALYEGRIAKRAQTFQAMFEEELAKVQMHCKGPHPMRGTAE